MDSAPALEQAFPPEALQLVLVLALSFLVGLERESRRGNSPGGIFGGVRTYPLIGLLGYGLSLLSAISVAPLVVGLGVVGLLMGLSLHHKFMAAETAKTSAGATSEVSALLVYVLGVLVQHGLYWISGALAVACLLLLELKGVLERLSLRLPSTEVLTFTKFLVLAVVILPIVPNRDFGPFAINPFRTWTVVVAVTAVSYGSYVLQRLLRASNSVRLTAVFGGAYSSTIVTVALSRKAAALGRPNLVSGSLLMASGVMYLRLGVLVGIFNHELLWVTGPSFVALAAMALATGLLWSRRADAQAAELAPTEGRNPLELSAAFLFAFLFMAMLVATKLAMSSLGKGGVLSLAALMGVTDVDPFILGMTQGAGEGIPMHLAAGAIILAAASNNAVKGFYGLALADRRSGVQILGWLGALAVLGLVPLLWLH